MTFDDGQFDEDQWRADLDRALNWSGLVDWDLLIAPRVTRFQRWWRTYR